MYYLLYIFVFLFVSTTGETRESPIVINEIMYHPASDRDEDEFIELYNRSGNPVDLSGWFFADGIRYSFPSGAIMDAGAYWIVAKDAANIQAKFGIDHVWGNYSGELSNNGEHLALANLDGEIIDEVTYSDSPPWPITADEFGPSLECINWNFENSQANAWSVNSGGIQWRKVQSEGIATGSRLYFYLQKAGTAWVDDVHLYDLNGWRREETAWPMTYRHIPSGDQALNLHLSHILIDLDPSQILVRITLPNDPRIHIFGIALVSEDGSITQAPLTSYFNADGISGPDNRSDGDLDSGGATLAAELLPPDGLVKFVKGSQSIKWQLGSYEDGINNTVRCTGQKISLPRSRFTQMHLLATAVNTQTIQEHITISYSGGEETAPFQVTDWAFPIPDTSAQEIEILQNGSFESGLSNWSTSGTHRTSMVSSDESVNGSQALYLQATAPGGEDGRVQQTLDGFQSGGRYRLEYWVREGSGANQVIAEMNDGSLHTDVALGGQGTPGEANSTWQSTLPPFVEEFSHSPERPTSNDPVTITARISGGEFIQSVSVEYTVRGTSQWLAMKDDGQHGDGLIGDGVYGAQIAPQSSQTPVFYVIQAIDLQGRIGLSPAVTDPTPRHGYFVYDGEVQSDLPTYFLFIESTDLRRLNPNTDDMVNAVVAVDGQVFDRIQVRYRGAWARSWPKKSWKLRFNKGHYYKGWRTSNLNSEYHDRAYMREPLGYDLFEAAGVPHPLCRFVWMQLNGEPFGLYGEVEQADERFLERVGREGASLYKSEGRYTVLGREAQYITPYQKETNIDEPHTSLITMIEDINSISDDEVYDYFIQHFNVDTYIDYLVVNACISNWDSIVKNHFVCQDVALTGKWEFFPWDLDRTWGEFPDWNLYPNQDILAGINGHPGPQLGSDWWNRVQDRLLNNEIFLSMFYNRMRQFLQTEFTEERMNEQIDAYDALIRDEVPLEKQIHGSHGNWNYANEVVNLKNYVRDRRNFLFQSMPVGVKDWQLY